MAERFDAGSDSALTNAEMDALDDSLRALEARAAAQNAEIDALADKWIAAREPGWKNLLIIRERDKAQQLLRELMEWAEEQAEGAENVAEKLKREGEVAAERRAGQIVYRTAA